MTDKPRKAGYCSRAGWNGATHDHSYFVECPICFALTKPDRADAHALRHNQKETS